MWVLSIFFLVSLNGEMIERREITRKTNEAEGPGGLRWVTIEEWDNMPGGKENNPLIYHWCPPGGKVDLITYGFCKYFIQVKANGCWQTGYAFGTYTDPYYTYPSIGNNGWGCCAQFCKHGFLHLCMDEKELGKYLPFRVLVNPGNSVDFTWLDWDYSKPFPKNVVYGDRRCGLKVATYLDSANYFLYESLQAGQVDKNGYIYYGTLRSRSSSWNYDWNEYKILVEKDIKEYKLLSIKYNIPEATKNIKQSIREFTFINDDIETTTRRTTLSFSETSSSTWSHSITWNTEQSGSFKISVGPQALAGSVEQTFGYSIKVGGSHGWGGSLSENVVGSETVVKEMPPKSGAKVTMSVQVSHENVPYEAKVKIVYEDDTHRVVTDKGIWRGVSVGKFRTTTGNTYYLSDLE